MSHKVQKFRYLMAFRFLLELMSKLEAFAVAECVPYQQHLVLVKNERELKKQRLSDDG